LGASGVCKTLTLRSLNGLPKLDSGSAIFKNELGDLVNIFILSNKKPRKVSQKTGVIF
jgi:ABC-type sulfate/molybdate transport systems ATPase subunit